MLPALAARSIIAIAAAAAAAAAPSPPPSAWQHIGPRAIGDDISPGVGLFGGEAGTLEDAASPASDPRIIYTGGANNGSASGVLKTTDMGKTWTRSSNGLYDTHIHGVFVYPGTVDHVLAGTPTGVYESTDGAASWTLIKATQAFGLCWSFRNGTIGGIATVLASCSRGVANTPVAGGGPWSLIPSYENKDWGGGAKGGLTIADDGATTVVAACFPTPGWGQPGGMAVIGTITSTTTADWAPRPAVMCWHMALDPNDKNRLLFSNATRNPDGTGQIWQSTDGGKTTEGTKAPRGGFYVTIDRKGWYYTCAEQGAYVSMDFGETW